MNDLNLTFYTSNPEVYRCPPKLLRQSFPQWWRDLPTKYNHEQWGPVPKPTMKSCDGLTRFFSNGFSIAMPEDIEFNIGENIEEGISTEFTQFQVHHKEQRGAFLDPAKYQHIKLLYPWFIDSHDDETPFAFIGNTWALDNPEDIIIPPGVLDFKTSYAAHINLFIPFSGKRTVKIKAGVPLVALIPLSERRVKIDCKFITPEEEFSKCENSYNTQMRIEKEAIEIEKYGRCPFHNPRYNQSL
jgi:hypothetical protein